MHFFSSDEAFQKLCDGLFEKFKDSPAHTDQQEWEPGQGVVSFYAKDQAWCRANIVTIEPTRVYVSEPGYGVINLGRRLCLSMPRHGVGPILSL